MPSLFDDYLNSRISLGSEALLALKRKRMPNESLKITREPYYSRKIEFACFEDYICRTLNP